MKQIRLLTVPPMWNQVRISECRSSDVQAVGFDAKGRKQYIYHPDWHKQRQAEKFERLATFAKLLPKIRGQYERDIALDNWSLQHICAIATYVLDSTGIRVGNQDYTKQNETYGLTTLRRRHLKTDNDQVHLQFIGKHNKERSIDINDDALSELIERCAELPGYSLFRYKQQRKWRDLTSDELNEYIQSISKNIFSSKYFRTWKGTRLAVEYALECDASAKEHMRKKFKPTLVKAVASDLGNTPSVCETYYIHPVVLETLVTLHEQRKMSSFFSEANKQVQQAQKHKGMEQTELIAIGIIEGRLSVSTASLSESDAA
ncbi:DNA topoisomerase IB [Ningiella sp. W23]|uniref:DNA topoisomerase IB n=1 Tax=Ningiella sp. W23 TaxID=3023715 RepID=UPI0037566EB7